PAVTVREENARAALEVMSRFAADPRWLIYLPPTISPAATSSHPGLLEHPAEAFAYFRHEGVAEVICEEKHMGSRAVIVVCRDDTVAPRRFGIEGSGVCYTRTGRPFFEDRAMQKAFLERMRAALETSASWERTGRTAGRSTVSTTSGWRRSRCWPGRGVRTQTWTMDGIWALRNDSQAATASSSCPRSPSRLT